MTARTSPRVDPAPIPIAQRERLLAAAEAILLNDGFHTLTTRAIASLANANISQIRYYFGSMEGLLDALLAEELKVVSAAFDNLAPDNDDQCIDELIAMLLKALKTPAAYTDNGFAALAIEAIYHHVSDGMRARAASTLEAAHSPFRAALAAALPGIDPLTMRIRLASAISMAMSMLPRGAGRRLLELADDGPECIARLDSTLPVLCHALIVGHACEAETAKFK